MTSDSEPGFDPASDLDLDFGFDPDLDPDYDTDFEMGGPGPFEPDEEEAILDLLSSRLDDGPVSLAELAEAVAAAGLITDGPDGPGPADLESLLRELLFVDETLWYHDGRVERTHRLLEGTIFTHRLTEADLASHRLPLLTDLCVTDFGLLPDPADTPDPTDSTEITIDDRGDTTRLAVPGALLAGRAAGELVGIRRRGTELTLEPVADPTDGQAELAAVLHQLQPVLDAGRGTTLTASVMDALMTEPGLFREPTPPLSELLTGAGLVHDEASFGPSDRVWANPDFVENLVARSNSAYELGECCVDALLVAYAGWRAEVLGMTEHPDAPGVTEIIGALSHGDVAPALVDALDHGERAGALRSFADDLLAAAETAGPGAVGPLVFVAYLAERSGDIDEAERLYRRALDLDGGSPAAIEGLAVMAIDRSDFPAAGRLLRRIYEPTDPHVTMTDQMAGLLLEAGRNDRCPCGSGRKYKVCHAGQPLTDPDHRIDIVLSKLANFAISRPRRDVLAETALRAMLDPEILLTSRFLYDTYLLDPANVDAYRSLRGSLLPDDETALLDRITGLPLRLVEVEQVEVEQVEMEGKSAQTRGMGAAVAGVELHDLMTDNRLRVRIDTAGANDLAPGQLGLVRLLDDRLVGQFTVLGPDDRQWAEGLLADGQPDIGRLLTWFRARV